MVFMQFKVLACVVFQELGYKIRHEFRIRTSFSKQILHNQCALSACIRILLKAGSTTRAQIKVNIRPTDSNNPMLAVPWWLVNARLEKLNTVVNAP